MLLDAPYTIICQNHLIGWSKPSEVPEAFHSCSGCGIDELNLDCRKNTLSTYKGVKIHLFNVVSTEEYK